MINAILLVIGLVGIPAFSMISTELLYGHNELAAA